jgi:ABC-2 type transport system ATP-binding protein
MKTASHTRMDVKPPSETVQPIVSTTGLSKRYGRRWAVRDLDLDVRRGDVFGFLGPNGAGKSTTIRMLLSLIRPTAGEVRLFGHSIRTERRMALQKVGGIVEKPDFYGYLSAVKNLEVVGSLYGGIPSSRIDEVLELVGLSDRGRDRVKTFSHGMKQRLGIAQALLSDPELIILDEPTSGLDPQGMKEIRDLITHLSRDRGKTIILSSHLLSEIELVANRMAVINRGKLVVQGEVGALLDAGEFTVFIRAEPRTEAAAVLTEQKRLVRSVTQTDDGFQIETDKEHVPALTDALVRSGVQVHAVIPRRSLEEYFLSITENTTEE